MGNKAILLDALEAARLAKRGKLEITGLIRYEGQPEQGDTISVKEPWYRLRPPPGAYYFDRPRYICQADATAEPYRFTYNPAQTMPQEAVKRHVVVADIWPGGVRLLLVYHGPHGDYTI